MDAADENLMRTALELAKRGSTSVEPNPMVGSVIVREGVVVGQGWHQVFGGPHAEIEALRDCRARGIDPAGATMYVTLEPCCHHGKTGPCADAIIEAGIGKVIVAMQDPAGHCDGGGIAKLHRAGVEVEVGCCERAARLLNAPFVAWHRQVRTWVVLKWAQSADGYLARAADGSEQWISNESSRADAHRLRRRVQGILVGIGTVLKDDPLLTPRPSGSRPLMRIVLDGALRMPVDCQLARTVDEGPVVVFASSEGIESNPDVAGMLGDAGVEIVECGQVDGLVDLQGVLDELAIREVCQLMVEGGATVLKSFWEKNLVDEVCVYTGPMTLGDGGTARVTGELMDVADGRGLFEVGRDGFGGDVRVTGLTERGMNAVGF